MITQGQPQYMKVHPAFFAMWQRVQAKQKAFEAIFTPAGLLSLFGIKRNSKVEAN